MDQDKAGKSYWEGLWDNNRIRSAVNPRARGLKHYVARRYHEFFSATFRDLQPRRSRLLEIGCARSSWLPYFAHEFGFQVTGLDYSETGCRQSQDILRNERVEGQVVCADLFAPPSSMLESFDVIVSFGVVEHFADTAMCLRAMASLLKAGGMIITTIPYMRGLTGLLQRTLNRPVFEIHNPINREQLHAAHTCAELKVLTCDYFLFLDLGVSNTANFACKRVDPLLTRVRSRIAAKAWRLARGSINGCVWGFETVFLALPANRWISPKINCVAIKQ